MSKKTKKNPAHTTTKPAPKDAATTTPSPFVDDPRLPKPGATITREYKGKTLSVKVVEGGFEFAGRQYRSLSALAREVTGAKSINGFLFWGLVPAKAQRPKAPRAKK